MRCNQDSITILVLAALQIVAGPALGCPPSKTWTTGPDDQAGFVLAEGALAAIRTAGPFEVLCAYSNRRSLPEPAAGVC